jgi:hypothetical protein
MKQEEFVSLYDFLGRPAGPELGREVYHAAQLSSQSTTIKQVSNPKYTGKVVMYKPEFLRKYFNGLTTTITEPTKTTTTNESIGFPF